MNAAIAILIAIFYVFFLTQLQRFSPDNLQRMTLVLALASMSFAIFIPVLVKRMGRNLYEVFNGIALMLSAILFSLLLSWVANPTNENIEPLSVAIAFSIAILDYLRRRIKIPESSQEFLNDRNVDLSPVSNSNPDSVAEFCSQYLASKGYTIIKPE